MLSRVADSLYWLSRYLERAEHTTRIFGVYLDIALDQTTSLEDDRYQQFLKILQIEDQVGEDTSLDDLIQLIIMDESNPNSVIYGVNQARENARQVREQISSETWMYINQLYLLMERPSPVLKRQPQLFIQDIMHHFHLIGGIADSTMSHNEGWQFMRLGGYMERAISLTHLIETHYAIHSGRDPSAEDYLDWVTLLRCCTAFEAYCNVYTADLQPSRIAEFLLLNPEFPHSLHFSVSMIHRALQQIANTTQSRRNTQLNRRIGRLQSHFQFHQIDEIMSEGIHTFLGNVSKQVQLIHDGVYQVYISFPVVEELPL